MQTIRASMPQEAPDTLGIAAYVDIVSYLLKANGSPAGATELPVENDALRQIMMSSHAPGRSGTVELGVRFRRPVNRYASQRRR